MRISTLMFAAVLLLSACAPTPNTTTESSPEPITTGGKSSDEPTNSESPKTDGPTAGSNPDQPISSETGGAAATPSGTNALDGTSEPSVGPESKPNPGVNGSASSTPAPQPGTQGSAAAAKTKWNATDVDPKEFGRLMDQTLYELEDAVAEFRVLMQNDEGAGTDAGKIMIADRTKYSIESFPMNELGRIAKDRADGTRRSSLTDKGWSKPSPVSTGWMEDNTDLVTTVQDKFARNQFRPILVGRPYWFSLVKQLRTKGYKVELKSNEQLVGGKMRPFYQLTANPKSKSDWAHEVLVDGIRRLPITIRLSKGKQVRQWSASWGFGQPVDEKNYELPKISAAE